jgi:hypothetical protein
MTTQTSTIKRPDVTKQVNDLIAKMHHRILSETTEKPKWYFVRDRNGGRFLEKDDRFIGPENKRDVYNKSIKFISDCDVTGYN